MEHNFRVLKMVASFVNSKNILLKEMGADFYTVAQKVLGVEEKILNQTSSQSQNYSSTTSSSEMINRTSTSLQQGVAEQVVVVEPMLMNKERPLLQLQILKF